MPGTTTVRPGPRSACSWAVGALLSGSVAAALCAPARAAIHAAPPPAGRPDAVLVQAPPPSALPSLVLPPAAGAEPPLFASLMRSGDVAMVRGDVPRARALYERAAAVYPGSSAAPLAVGKTHDPNMLSLLNLNGAGLADAGKAREWYERARALGDPAAASLLAALR